MPKNTKKCFTVLTLSGALLIVFGTVCFIKGDGWIQAIIDSKLVIKPNSPIYRQWISPTVPVRMQFFVFNVENPLEMKQGEQPYVTQKGPYCYRVHQLRKNITWNDNSTVSFNKFTKYIFSAECSSPRVMHLRTLSHFPMYHWLFCPRFQKCILDLL